MYPSSASGNEYEALHKRSMNLQREVDKLSILREITLSVISTLDLNEALRNIADVVQSAIDVRKVAIYELRKKENVFHALIIPIWTVICDRIEGDFPSLAPSLFCPSVVEVTERIHVEIAPEVTSLRLIAARVLNQAKERVDHNIGDEVRVRQHWKLSLQRRNQRVEQQFDQITGRIGFACLQAKIVRLCLLS